jgi:ABC-type cobalamin transport system permease subunit
MLSGIGIATLFVLVGLGISAAGLSIIVFRRGKLYQWLNPEASPYWVLRIYLPTLLLALAPPIGLAIVSAGVGIHSTPGIWFMLLSIPGVAVGMGAGSALGENDLVFYVATVVANWAFYVCVVIGALSLKKKLYERGIRRPAK